MNYISLECGGFVVTHVVHSFKTAIMITLRHSEATALISSHFYGKLHFVHFWDVREPSGCAMVGPLVLYWLVGSLCFGSSLARRKRPLKKVYLQEVKCWGTPMEHLQRALWWELRNSGLTWTYYSRLVCGFVGAHQKSRKMYLYLFTTVQFHFGLPFFHQGLKIFFLSCLGNLNNETDCLL